MSDSEHQINIDKHHRRSSILKPAKVIDNRAPLQELGASSDDTTTTTSSIYKKRVSFHVINIKEYSTHAQTQEVQKNPAYNEFLSSMSDSSRNNTNNECSNFSPMVPAYVIPQDEDKENQINYGDDSDSLVEEDTSELYEDNLPGQYNEPFDLSTKSKHEESKNFLESTKLSHCNTIMTTFNISGIQNLEESNMEDGDESDDSSFQRMIDQQPPAINVFQYQPENQEAEHDEFSDSIELTCHVPLDNRPNTIDESSMQMTAALPRRKSHAPRKSVNFKHTQDDTQIESDEMDFTSAFPPMAHAASTNENDLDKSAMDVTGVFPRKSFGPIKLSEMNSSSTHAEDVQPIWSKSLTNKTVLNKSMEFSNNALSESALTKSSEMFNSQSSHCLDASGMNFSSVPQKCSRKSICGNVFKNQKLENFDESGMEMTEAFHGIPPNISTDYASKVYDVSMSDSISDMDISNQSPPNVTNTTESMILADKTSFANTNLVDFTIKTGFPEDIGHKSMGATKMWELNDSQLNNIDLVKNPILISNAAQNKSFSGFENSAHKPSTTLHRKSAPHYMISSNCAISSPDKSALNKIDLASKVCKSSDNSTSKINVCSAVGITSSFENNSSFVSDSKIPVNVMKPSNNSNIRLELDSSVQEQSKLTQDCTFTSLQPVPMAHSTNLNISPGVKNSSLQNIIQESSVTSDNSDNNAISLNKTSSNRRAISVNSTSVQQIRPSINMSTHEDSMELSCAFVLNSKSAFSLVLDSGMDLSSLAPDANMSDLKPTDTTDQFKVQSPSKRNKENCTNTNTNNSILQTESIEKKSTREDIDVHPTVTSIIRNKESLGEVILTTFEHEKTVPDVQNMSVDCSNIISPADSDCDSASSKDNKDSSGNVVLREVLNYETALKSNEIDDVPTITDTKESPQKTSILEKTETFQVSTNDGFFSTRQSIGSGISPLESAQPSVTNLEVERSRKRPSDGFETHEENLVECGDSIVVANPKKKSKTFELEAFIQETREVEVEPINDSTREVHDSSTSTNKPSVLETDRNEISDVLVTSASHVFEPTPSKTPVVSETPSKTPGVAEAPRKIAMAVATPSNTPVALANPIKTPVVAEFPSKTPVVTLIPSKTAVAVATPSKTPVVVSTPGKTAVVVPAPSKTPVVPRSSSKTASVAATLSKTPIVASTPSKIPVVDATPSQMPIFVTPVKPPVIATPNKVSAAFVTPVRNSETGSNEHCSEEESIDSFNMSTYANPSSTLTDSIIHNITDIIGLPLIGSVRKLSASEVKAKQVEQISSCSTPLLPNSCSKTMIVDRFFQSMDNRIKQPENFVVPSKNIIKKLDMTRKEKEQISPDKNVLDNTSPTNNNFPSDFYKNIPINSSVDPNLSQTLKRTKDQLNISKNDDPNSSNYIPEKQQRNISVNGIINTSQHSTVESVVNDISLLDISGDFEKIDKIQSTLATTLNITDVPDKSTNVKDHHPNERNSSSVLNETETVASMSLVCHSDKNDKLNTPEEIKGNTEVLKVIQSTGTEEKIENITKEDMKNSETTYSEVLSVERRLDRSVSTEGTMQENHTKDSTDQSPVEQTNFMKKRKSRLSIVPKHSPVKVATNQKDMKRKTLKIQPKQSIMRKSMMFESGDDSMEEVQDYAEQKILAEEKRGNHEWKLKTLESNLWEFEFFNDLTLKVEFNSPEKKSRKDKLVKNVCFETCDSSTELKALCFKLLLNKYMLSSMCSSSCDVVPILQHISPFMSYLKKFAQTMKLCELKYGMKLQGTKVFVDITSYSKLEWSQVSLDINNIDFIQQNDIHVTRMFGKLTESEVRKQFPVFNTKDNSDFMKTFIENIYSQIDAQ